VFGHVTELITFQFHCHRKSASCSHQGRCTCVYIPNKTFYAGQANT